MGAKWRHGLPVLSGRSQWRETLGAESRIDLREAAPDKGEATEMSAKIETVTETRTVSKPTSWVCDICGRECTSQSRMIDGFEFRYRGDEEDELSVFAPDICDDCYFDDDFYERVRAVFDVIRAFAPYAEVRIANDPGESE